MTTSRWAQLCEHARIGDPEGAARALMAEASPKVAAWLMNAALWRDADVQDFERRRLAVLLGTRWGQFWLASPDAPGPLDPPACRVAPSGVVALARGLVAVLAE